MNIRYPSYRKQHGATLMISLMLLLVMTLIGVTAMGTSSLEEKMAGNARDKHLAFNAAEAALRDAERYVTEDIVSVAAFDGSYTGLYAVGSDPDITADATWANSLSYAGTIDGIKTEPKYIVEVMGNVGNEDPNIGDYSTTSGAGVITTYRITARGTGGSDNSVVMLQSYYGRRF